MEFKFEFPLGGGSGDGGSPGGRRPEPGSGDGGSPGGRRPEPGSGDGGSSGDRQGPAPAAAQRRRRLREHVVGDPADLRPLLERAAAAAVSVLEAGGLRIKHIEPSALLWPGAEGEEEEEEEEEEGPGAEEGGPGAAGAEERPGAAGSGPGAEEGGPGEEGPGAEEGGHVGERAAPGPGKERPGAGQGRLPWDLLSHSDLVPGLYEGGLKVWECTVDLVDYLAGVELRGLRVLDLGCGAGLLGIAALGKGAACVHFQDYNGEVLERLTIPNVALLGRSLPGPEVGGDDEPPAKRSRAEGSLLARCRFFSGPWSLFAQVHGDRDASFKYDVILSSETLYNPHSYAALHHALTSLLSDQGTIYLATKAHYFGVGGGIHLFQNFVKEKQIFDLRTVKVIDDGLQRCIALMSFRRGRSP